MKINTIILFLIGGVISSSAFATNGMQPIGSGAISKGMAGAGAAATYDVLSGSYNPASIARLENQFDASVSFFNPTRSYDSQSDAFNNKSEVESENPLFLIPAMGVVHNINEKTSFAAIMFAKGGGGVTYQEEATYSNFGGFGKTTDGEGVWTSSEVEQVGISLPFGFKLGEKHSIGVGPLIGVQRFRATGLGYFIPFSSDPDKLTDNGWSWSTGLGATVGFQSNLSRWFSVGASYHSEVLMSKFEEYTGLFAEGRMDYPAQWIAGATFRPNDKLDINIDYQLIKYSDVKALANSHSQELGVGLGADANGESIFKKTVGGGADGAGFGWDDVHIYKIGTSYRLDKEYTLRAGYSYGNSPVGSEDVLFNILAPAVTEQHVSFGFSRKFKKQYEFNMAYVRTLKNTVSGRNPNNGVADSEIDLSMEQHDLEMGVSYLF